MKDTLLLGQAEEVEGRLFTGLERTAEDLAAMRYMLEGVRRVLRYPPEILSKPRPITLFLEEQTYGSHRVVLSNIEGLRRTGDFTVVGFFGQSRPEVEPEWADALERADEDLIREFPKYPGVLSYSTLELQNGDFGDLALLEGPDVIEHWDRCSVHEYAAVEVSPRVYSSVRLQTGALYGGLMSRRDIVLIQTKYFDYANGARWRAFRKLEASRPDRAFDS